MFFHLYYHAAFKTRSHSSERQSPVSVVVCARNELDNLQEHLPLLLEQDYPDYEVVVVDDASWDNTGEYLSELKLKESKLEVVTITEDQKRTAGKKMALTLGFKRAKHDLFLLTDADCRPKSKDWIAQMVSCAQTDIVLGYGAYEKTGGLLNLFIRFDTWSVAVQYIGAALRGRAYMGVGRNLLYTRSHYHDSGGFRSHYHLISGDDDLLVNHTATKKNIAVMVDKSAHTVSRSAKSWGGWFRQKRRHMSASKAYTGSSKLRLWIYHLGQLGFYLLLALGLAMKVPAMYLAVAYGTKTTIHLLISIRAARELEEKEMLVLLPLLEPLMLIINLGVGLWSKVSTMTSWK